MLSCEFDKMYMYPVEIRYRSRSAEADYGAYFALERNLFC